MTHRTTSAHDQTAAADAGACSASLGNTLAALLAPDDIVRPELRNAAILKAQRASQGRRHAARNHHALTRRS